MTLYELNQAGYASLPELTDSQKEEAKQTIERYINHYGAHAIEYFMLLNNDLHYYTVFSWISDDFHNLSNEVMNIAEDLGQIKSVEANDNDVIEFWITGEEGTNMYVFFNYTQGVVEV